MIHFSNLIGTLVLTLTCYMSTLFFLVQNPSLGISFDPLSKALVTDKRIGGLQFYLPQTDHHIFSVSLVYSHSFNPLTPGFPIDE